MQEMTCFKTKCTDEKNYIGCAPADMIDDIMNEFTMYCDPPKILSNNIDIVEIISPKDKLKFQKRTNDDERLNVEIK